MSTWGEPKHLVTVLKVHITKYKCYYIYNSQLNAVITVQLVPILSNFNSHEIYLSFTYYSDKKNTTLLRMKECLPAVFIITSAIES